MFKVALLAFVAVFVSSESQCPTGDHFCQSVEGPASYCMNYKQATAVCHGPSKTPCTCTPCVSGDSYCIRQVGLASYCKYYQDKNVCEGSDEPCSCEY